MYMQRYRPIKKYTYTHCLDPITPEVMKSVARKWSPLTSGLASRASEVAAYCMEAESQYLNRMGDRVNRYHFVIIKVVVGNYVGASPLHDLAVALDYDPYVIDASRIATMIASVIEELDKDADGARPVAMSSLSRRRLAERLCRYLQAYYDNL